MKYETLNGFKHVMLITIWHNKNQQQQQQKPRESNQIHEKKKIIIIIKNAKLHMINTWSNELNHNLHI